MAWKFSPEVLHDIARGVVELPLPERIPTVVRRVHARYPDLIDPAPRWIFNNAGGAMGSMLILHASVTEYVIVFGSAVGTEGHSGRFPADDYFMVLHGEQWAYRPGELEKRVYGPGDLHHMPRGVACGYRFPDTCWALEYARGAIPLMLPFGLADALTSTLDLPSLGQTLATYGRHTLRHLLRGRL